MNIFTVFIIIFAVYLKCAKQKKTEATLAVQDRVALLKLQIAQEIKKNQLAQGKLHPINNKDFGDSYEYEDLSIKRITPIMDFDERKKDNRFKMKQIKTTPASDEHPFPKRIKKSKIKKNRERSKDSQQASSTEIKSEKDEPYRKETVYNSEDESSSNEVKMEGINAAFSDTKNEPEIEQIGTLSVPKKVKHKKGDTQKAARHGEDSKSIQPIANKKKHKLRHSDNIFYRRTSSFLKYIKPDWIHCQDMVTPFIRGHKTNMTKGKTVSITDNSVRRLLQLMSEDTSDDSLDDIYSLIYQISNLHIRLFQWEIPALKTLLNVISKEQRKVHTFRTLKSGLKRMFASWHLDLFSNTTNLLKQAKLFRPPCVRVTPYEGSTKTSKSIRYTKSVKPRCSREEVDDECEI